MSYDDYEEEMPPGDDDLDDFATFDAERFLRKRGGDQNRPLPDEDSVNSGYTSRRRSYAQDNLPPAGSARTTRRRRSARSSARDNDSGLNDAAIPALGLGSQFIDSLGSGAEMTGIVSRIFREGGPAIRAIIGVGCILLVGLMAVCGIGCLLLSASMRQ
jgi:hypothetical protein